VATCPAGHASATTDYCDECGVAMGPPSSSPGLRRCPACGEVLDDNARFCEVCGHDSTQPPPAPPTWSVVATADRSWFAEVCRREGPDIASVTFPRHCPPRTFPLTGAQMSIGRRSRSRGIEPEIDLSGPPLDPGVSTLHAVLLEGPDGSWDLVDVGSRNGTVINESPDPIIPNVPVRLSVGDRIKIGAWTVLTVSAAQSR
jgi:FHA domain/Double zinc ribbon